MDCGFVFRRHAPGVPIDLSTRNLSDGNEWWWPNAPVGPMAVWVIGALAGFVAIALAAYLWGGVTRERLQEHQSRPPLMFTFRATGATLEHVAPS